jgi:hypothetical protein
MMPLSDDRWKTLHGGYRTIYDASEPLRQLEEADSDFDRIWTDLSSGLHHQGDVDEASYAAVPHIARITIRKKLRDAHPFALVACIEACRQFGQNPKIPDWMSEAYRAAIAELAAYALQLLPDSRPKHEVPYLLAVVALRHSCAEHAYVLSQLIADEVEEIIRGSAE